MNAKIVPFRTPSAIIHALDGRGEASESSALLQSEIDRLEQLDHDLQVEAHRINLALGEVRRKRWGLLRCIARLRSA